MERYDSIVVGAGHNGLTCAAYLAKAGQRVLVLEAAAAPGGLATSREFADGYRAPLAHSIGHFSKKVAADLSLAAHGYDGGAGRLPTIGLGRDRVDLSEHAQAGVGDKDASRYRELIPRLARMADALAPFWQKTMPRIGNNSFSDILTFGHLGLNVRRLGKDDMREFLRVFSLPTRDLMDENFDNETLKAVLSWDGLIGSKMAPRSPNGAVLAMLYRLAGKRDFTHALPPGGVASLVDALDKAARAAGAEVRCDAPVARIAVEGDGSGLRTTGVELASGETVAADRVISAVDPKNTFLRLVGVEHLEVEFANRIRRLRSDGLVAKLHLALDGLPQFTGDAENARAADGRIVIADDMEAIELAFDAAKYGELPAAPVMECVVPSVHQAGLAPDGKHVLSAHVMFVPYALKGGWTDDARGQLKEQCVAALARHAPGIREQLVASELLTPADIERDYRVSGGHWHHGEFAMDQLLMMRPTYGAAQYRAPIPGLWLCSAGSHPGGDLTGLAGHNAAQEVLR